MDKRTVWLWLSLHFGAGTTVYSNLLSMFSSEEEIYECDDDDLFLNTKLNDSQKNKLLDKNIEHAEEIIEWCEDNDVKIIAYSDDDYPEPLRQLPNFPAVLYCRGTLPDFSNELAIAVVGTRNMTYYGQKIAFDMGYGLSNGGAIVVSGMALGIDSTAAMGTLNANGRTVAVLGSGIDVIYPKQNIVLMESILKDGAVITEFPPFTPPNARNFPIRNRIISGLCAGTVVVEADINSGALITARCAVSQGRDLFAVPGPVRVYSSSGTNKLIKEDGATVVTSAIDVLEQFLDRYSDKINLKQSKNRPMFKKAAIKFASDIYDPSKFYAAYNEREKQKELKEKSSDAEKITSAKPDLSTLSETERNIYDLMPEDMPITEDYFLGKGIPVGEITASMTMLEIIGAVESKPGGYYIKK